MKFLSAIGKAFLALIGALVLLVVVVFFVAVSSQDEDTRDIDVDTTTITTASTESPTEPEGESESESEDKEVVVFEDEYIRVTYVGMSSTDNLGFVGLSMKFKIENISDITVTVYSSDVYVNDMSADALTTFYEKLLAGKYCIAAGKYCIATLTDMYDGIEMEDVEKVEFAVKVIDESYNTLDTSDVITISLK